MAADWAWDLPPLKGASSSVDAGIQNVIVDWSSHSSGTEVVNLLNFACIGWLIAKKVG